jgi:hypothetical protein
MNNANLLVEKVINRLTESADIDPKFIYHCAHNSEDENKGYKAIFKFGFERYFVNKGIGNMYGPGVYTTVDLNSSITNAHRGEYGRIIIKAEIQSYDKFLIWNKLLAQATYGGKWKNK